MASTTGQFGLRAVVVPDEGVFFAQGLDVDYFASGQTIEEAEKNFEDGLETLVALHVEKFGNVDRLRPVSENVREEYANVSNNMATHTLRGVAARHLNSKVLYFLP